VKVHIFVTDAFELKLELGVITDENQLVFFFNFLFFLFVPITTYTTNLTDQWKYQHKSSRFTSE